MATATRSRSEKASQNAAKRWKAGTQHYQEKFRSVAEDIHKTAKQMPHGSLDDAEAIVEMAIEKTRQFAEEYHQAEED